jgi:hypothetical protein
MTVENLARISPPQISALLTTPGRPRALRDSVELAPHIPLPKLHTFPHETESALRQLDE